MAMEEDRCLSGGMSLPMWMRTRSRLHERLDFDQSTFSPPENDDNFLYIRYTKIAPQTTNSKSGGEVKTITINENGGRRNSSNINGAVPFKLDISKHTPPCKDYILGRTDCTMAPPIPFVKSVSLDNSLYNFLCEILEPAQSQIVNTNGKPKSAGTDDGFKGEAAACGTSVIRVASQMVSGKLVKGFESFEEEEKEHLRTIGFDPKLRRGSRSLPASPLQSPSSSPKSRRKQVNKFFAGTAYADDKKPGSILANLLAKRDQNLSKSVTSIAEEPIKMPTIEVQEIDKKVVHKPKPSQLREMNFWSPTSM